MGFLDPVTITSDGASGGGLSKNAQGVIGGLGAGVLGGIQNAISPNPGSTTKTTSNSSSTPTYSSAVLPLYNQLLKSYMGGADGSNSQNFFNGYQSQGQQQINQNSQAGTNNTNRILAMHGLSTSPYAATAGIQQELARQAQMSTFNNSVPLLQHQDQQQQLRDAGGFFSSLPVGQEQSGSSTSTTTQPKQSFLSGLLGGVAQALPSALALF